jgi:hypothetical protein
LASVLSCFRGTYRQHATKGFRRNKGDPPGSTWLVGPNKLNQRGGAEGLTEVRLRVRLVLRGRESRPHGEAGSRSWHRTVRWEQLQQIKSQFPPLKPKLHLSYPELRAIAKRRINFRRAQLPNSRWVLWEPEAGDCLRPPGGRAARFVPIATGRPSAHSWEM